MSDQRWKRLKSDLSTDNLGSIQEEQLEEKDSELKRVKAEMKEQQAALLAAKEEAERKAADEIAKMMKELAKYKAALAAKERGEDISRSYLEEKREDEARIRKEEKVDRNISEAVKKRDNQIKLETLTSTMKAEREKAKEEAEAQRKKFEQRIETDQKAWDSERADLQKKYEKLKGMKLTKKAQKRVDRQMGVARAKNV